MMWLPKIYWTHQSQLHCFSQSLLPGTYLNNRIHEDSSYSLKKGSRREVKGKRMYCPGCHSSLISFLPAQHHFPSTTLFNDNELSYCITTGNTQWPGNLPGHYDPKYGYTLRKLNM